MSNIINLISFNLPVVTLKASAESADLYETLHLISVISFIVAAILFLVAIALFFLLDIPKVIGDLTGANAKKAIEDIRKQNETTGDKAFKPSPENLKRSKVTDKITPSGNLEKVDHNPLGVAVGTAKLAESPASQTVVLDSAGETEVLSAAGETAVLDETMNPVENTAFGETAILGDPAGETTVLNDQPVHAAPTEEAADDGFNVDYSVEFKGSDELIE